MDFCTEPLVLLFKFSYTPISGVSFFGDLAALVICGPLQVSQNSIHMLYSISFFEFSARIESHFYAALSAHFSPKVNLDYNTGIYTHCIVYHTTHVL